ncbi:MAG: sulfotransferase family protein [Paracoccaceae bacterium]
MSGQNQAQQGSPAVEFSLTPAQEWRDRLARPLAQTVLPFFRRYPYRGPCSLFHLNLRGAFSPTDRFFYNRIPKAANTTISKLLAKHSDYQRPWGSRGDKGRMLRPAHMTRAQVEALASGEVFRFLIVRDPYTRVLSAYQDKFLRKLRQVDRYGAMIESAPGEVPSFAAFCRFLDRGGVWRDAHWAPQSALMLLPLDAYDLIGRVETLDQDMATLVQRIWGIAPEPVEFAGTRTGASKAVEQAYDDESRAIVARLYRDDFELFGYQA